MLIYPNGKRHLGSSGSNVGLGIVRILTKRMQFAFCALHIQTRSNCSFDRMIQLVDLCLSLFLFHTLAASMKSVLSLKAPIMHR